jgi:PTH1 family peptidyl-tRNA hydrolase
VRLIVGLGNPGKEYRETRHNVGFMVLDELARRHQLQWAMAPGQVPETFVAKKFGEPAWLLAKPLTYMNNSGDAVAALSRYYDIAPADTLVVVDEVALPFCKLRARARGSAGGHNGLKSVIARLGSTEFPRLRLGVGRGDGRRDLADHVLAKFESGERADLETFIARAADAAEMFAVDGIGTVMNTYNPDATAPDND